MFLALSACCDEPAPSAMQKPPESALARVLRQARASCKTAMQSASMYAADPVRRLQFGSDGDVHFMRSSVAQPGWRPQGKQATARFVAKRAPREGSGQPAR
jgi:hypothetical protein